MSESELAAIESACAAATAGPWYTGGGPAAYHVYRTDYEQDGNVACCPAEWNAREASPQQFADAAFIALARTAGGPRPARRGPPVAGCTHALGHGGGIGG